MTLLMPAITWLTGLFVVWLSGRYHLTADQQQSVTADVTAALVGGAAMAGGLVMHWRAYLKSPPGGEKDAKISGPSGGSAGLQPGNRG